MAEHLTHTGVHDHGFNNISTYGNLRRLMLEGRIPINEWELHFYELALKVSGAVQAARWTSLKDGLGYIYSFNGSHSLFIDTIRTLRICCMAHMLGHTLQAEQDQRIDLLDRALTHAKTSALFNVYYGEGRDHYDIPELRGRTVHEAIFNPASGVFRCPSSQQGYSPFTTWTRGLAWAHARLCRADGVPSVRDGPQTSKRPWLVEKAARACCDFYIQQASALDGICYWDTGAPQLHSAGRLAGQTGRSLQRLRAGRCVGQRDRRPGIASPRPSTGRSRRSLHPRRADHCRRLLQEPYLAVDPAARRSAVAQHLPSP